MPENNENTAPTYTNFGMSDEALKLLLDKCLKPEEIAGDPALQLARVNELVHWFARLAAGHANSKWAVAHAFELAWYVATQSVNREVNLREIKLESFIKGMNTTDAERQMWADHDERVKPPLPKPATE